MKSRIKKMRKTGYMQAGGNFDRKSTPGYESDKAASAGGKDAGGGTGSFDKFVVVPEQFKALRYELLGEDLIRLIDSLKNKEMEEKKKRSAEPQEIMRNGGKTGGYIKYFDKGGRVAGRTRAYQSGGETSAQDLMKQLYQLTQLAVSGSGQQQQQAAQALGQFVSEAMNGNQQYEQIIQVVFDGANNGDKQMTQIAQVLQAIMQQMQKKADGGKLSYIKKLRNGGKPSTRMWGGGGI